MSPLPCNAIKRSKLHYQTSTACEHSADFGRARRCYGFCHVSPGVWTKHNVADGYYQYTPSTAAAPIFLIPLYCRCPHQYLPILLLPRLVLVAYESCSPLYVVLHTDQIILAYPFTLLQWNFSAMPFGSSLPMILQRRASSSFRPSCCLLQPGVMATACYQAFERVVLWVRPRDFQSMSHL